ncbi:NnrU family protein, partial [Aeromonas molluscorum]
MILLILGVLLFALVHLYPCFAQAHRGRLRERLGESRY